MTRKGVLERVGGVRSFIAETVKNGGIGGEQKRRLVGADQD